jgi:hypothetical protein
VIFHVADILLGDKVGFYYRHGPAASSGSLTVSKATTMDARGAELLVTVALSSAHTGSSLSDLGLHIQFFEIA